MIDQHVVKLITDYLDKAEADATPATLVGVFWYVDYLNRTPPVLEEVNQALACRPRVGVEHTTGGVTFVFGRQKLRPDMTEDDIERAYAAYHEEFSLKLKDLTNHKK